MVALEKKLCTSQIFKKGSDKEKPKECGKELLIITNDQDDVAAYICEECDALELLPVGMRERIVEQ